jgi:pectate lyase
VANLDGSFAEQQSSQKVATQVAIQHAVVKLIKSRVPKIRTGECDVVFGVGAAMQRFALTRYG